MTRIYLIRHAEAEGNFYRRAHGHFDSLLVENGHQQLRALAKRFEDEQVDAVYSSNLRRARSTAASIAVPRGLNIIAKPELREINLGIWEDRTWGWVTHFFAEDYDTFSNNPWLFSATHGESVVELGARAVGAIHSIVAENPGKNVAVVSHGMAIRAIMSHLEFGSCEKMNKTSFGDNASFTTLEIDGGAVNIVCRNENEHLGSLSTFARQQWWRTSSRDYEVWFRKPDEKFDAEFIGFCRRAQLKKTAWDTANEVYIAVLDNDPVGMIELDSTSAAGSLRISDMYLLEPFRAQTIGAQLLGQAISECRKKNCDRLHIYAPKSNENILRFCRKYNFTVVNDNYKGQVLFEMRMTPFTRQL